LRYNFSMRLKIHLFYESSVIDVFLISVRWLGFSMNVTFLLGIIYTFVLLANLNELNLCISNDYSLAGWTADSSLTHLSAAEKT
jgi:hypothetical protein